MITNKVDTAAEESIEVVRIGELYCDSLFFPSIDDNLWPDR